MADGSIVDVTIFDTAGQEKYKSITLSYYSKANCCLLVYDIASRKSFEEIKQYYNKKIKENCKNNIKVLLLGNKTDLEADRKVSSEEACKLALENDYIFMESSCLKNTNVANAFVTLIELANRDKENIANDSIVISKENLRKEKKEKSSKCGGNKSNQTNSKIISSTEEHLEKDKIGTLQNTEQKAKIISSTSEYLEKDNLGTRQDTLQKANNYWTSRVVMPEKHPFTLFKFTSGSNAEQALLELPYIHKAKDTNNLICKRPLIFGYYKTEDGIFESIICGKDLTLDEFDQAENAFRKHGGILKNNLKPLNSSENKQKNEENIDKVGNSDNVKFNKKYQKEPFTYECYLAKNKADAMAFLNKKTVEKSLYYIVVDTPEGSFGRDIYGIYEE